MAETVVWAGYFLLMGLAVGSFLNVVIFRMPAGESVAWPGSHCYGCQKPIAWYDNLPVVSWFILRGRCRCRANALSIRYPLIEAITGLLWMAVYLRFGLSWHTVVLVLWTAILIVIAMIDLDTMLIYDLFTVPGMVIGPVLAGLGLLPISFIDSLAGVGVGLLVLGGIAGASALFYKEALGWGDVKYLMMAGGFLGWQQGLFVIALGAVLGSVISVPLLATGVLRRDQPFPFGPYLVAATLISIFVGPEVVEWYWAAFEV